MFIIVFFLKYFFIIPILTYAHGVSFSRLPPHLSLRALSAPSHLYPPCIPHLSQVRFVLQLVG